MTTSTTAVAQVSAAALAQALLEVEAAIARELRRAGRIEDAERGRLRLPEGRGMMLDADHALWLELQRGGVTIRRLGESSPVLSWTAARAIDQVLAMRAEGPEAAHGRDLQRAGALVDWWRHCYEHSVQRLASAGPQYRYGDGPGAVVLGREHPVPGCPLWDREEYSRMLAAAIDARAQLAASGPAWPEQQSLF